MRQHLTLHTVTLKQLTKRDKMNCVTYNNIRLKCYLNLIVIVADVKWSAKVLAWAIAKIQSLIEKNKDYNSSFSTVTTTSPLSFFSQVHFTLSPAAMCSDLAISCGMPHLNEVYWGLA